jgi:amino acid transporter
VWQNSLPVTPTRPSDHVIRGLGLIAATSIVIGEVIGTGVFLKARVMTCNVGTPGMVITVWIVGGLFSLAGALVYAELAAMMPRTGGEYVFIREAYGRLWGFLYGWMRFFVAGTGAQAALAIGFAIFINVATRGAIGTNYFTLDLLGYQIAFGGVQAFAITAIFVVTLVNILVLSGSFDALTDYAIFAVVIFLGLTASSIFVFRRRMPEAERPYRTWGYPVVPALFLLMSGLLIGNTLLTMPRQALAGLGLMALGLPFYRYWSRRPK